MGRRNKSGDDNVDPMDAGVGTRCAMGRLDKPGDDDVGAVDSNAATRGMMKPGDGNVRV